MCTLINKILSRLPWPHVMFNRDLLNYLPVDTISRIIHMDEIDEYECLINSAPNESLGLLNWDILSSHALTAELVLKYRDKMNWPVYLTNGHPKDVLMLYQVKDKLYEHRDVFASDKIKARYYDDFFISTFPEIIDWKWCARNIKLTEFTLLYRINNFDMRDISRYQRMTHDMILQLRYRIIWHLAICHPIESRTLPYIADMLDWSLVCIYQRLTSRDINKFIEYLKPVAFYLVVYQRLTLRFIKSNIDWLPLHLVAMFQKLPFRYIIRNLNRYSPALLAQNKHYNRATGIQIIQQGARWFIMDIPNKSDDIRGEPSINIHIHKHEYQPVE